MGLNNGAARAGGKRPLFVFLTAGAVTIVAYKSLNEGIVQSSVYDVIGLASAAAILWSRHHYRPELGGCWAWLAAGVFLSVSGDIVWGLSRDIFHTYPDGTITDLLYLFSYPCLALGVLGFVRARSPGKDKAARLDAAIFACGFGLIGWQLTMQGDFPPQGVTGRRIGGDFLRKR